MTTSNHMTVGEFIELLLDGELTIERLERFGNKFDEFSQEYSMTRSDPGYLRNVQTEMNLLVGYLRNGLPTIYERITKRGREPREFLQSFLEDISQDTLAFIITYTTREEIKQALESE